MSSNNWYNTESRANLNSKMNGMVVLNKGVTTLNDFTNSLMAVHWEEVFGLLGANDLLNSITVYPFSLTRSISNEAGGVGHLVVGQTYYETNTTAGISGIQVQDFDAKAYSAGFHISSFKVDKASDFKDLEPYSKMDVWLPYYGLVNIPLSKARGYWVNIILHVDFYTGKAVYSIATSKGDLKPLISSVNYPLMYDSDDDILFSTSHLVEILSTHEFQLGYNYPLSRVGYSDFVRDLAVTAIAAGISIYSASAAIPAQAVGSEVKTTIKTRNPKSGRLVKAYENTKTYSPADENYIKNYQTSNVSRTVASSLSSLGNIQLSGSTQSVNNQIISWFGPQSVHVIETKATVVDNDSAAFSHLYGRPLGEVELLYNLHGYADLSTVELVGEGFSEATDEELDGLYSILTSGVYLP